MNKNIFFLLTLVFVISSCKQGTKDKQSLFDVKVSKNASLLFTSYAIVDTSESIIFQVYQKGVNKGVIHYRYKGKSKLQDRIPKLDAIFYTIFNDTSVNFDITTIAWGRLADSFNRDYTFSKRMVLYAKKSESWDAGGGVPFNGGKNEFVKSLRDEFAFELDSLLNKYNYYVESISAEKVLVGSADKFPFWGEIKAEVNPYDKLPFDCQLWFNLRKIE